jgi:hypothetical protein
MICLRGDTARRGALLLIQQAKKPELASVAGRAIVVR